MQLFNELRRRNVFRVAAAYLVSAWLIIQVVETIFPAFGFGEAAIRVVVITLGIGLIPVLILSWAFEFTAEGLRLDKRAGCHSCESWAGVTNVARNPPPTDARSAGRRFIPARVITNLNGFRCSNCR